MEHYKRTNQDEQNSTLTGNTRDIAKKFQAIYSQVEIYYTSAIGDVIRRQSRDAKEIEHLLDYMLDFTDNKTVLASYRKLYHYYLDINPQATAEYI